MAVAVSKLVDGNANDVLAGTVLGVLPSTAEQFDVEVRVTSLEDDYTRAMTLLVNGGSVLERALVINGRVADTNFSVNNLTALNTEPNSDGPTAFFRAPAGSRLTMNISGASTGNITNVYVEARESGGPGIPLGVGHIASYNVASAITELDVLSGTPIGALPATAGAWNIALQAAVSTVPDSTATASVWRQDANITLQVGDQIVCENFILPGRGNSSRLSYCQFGVEERDTLITTLGQGGDRITLNLYKPTANAFVQSDGTAISVAGQLVYRIFANPVG